MTDREMLELAAKASYDDYDEAAREATVRLRQLKAADHYTRCRDCGVFVDKSRWVRKDSVDAIQREQRPLCDTCWCMYDNPLCYP